MTTFQQYVTPPHGRPVFVRGATVPGVVPGAVPGAVPGKVGVVHGTVPRLFPTNAKGVVTFDSVLNGAMLLLFLTVVISVGVLIVLSTTDFQRTLSIVVISAFVLIALLAVTQMSSFKARLLSCMYKNNLVEEHKTALFKQMNDQRRDNQALVSDVTRSANSAVQEATQRSLQLSHEHSYRR